MLNDPFDLKPTGSTANKASETRALKDLVRKQFDLDEAAPVFVAEVTCGEVDCPDTETVIAVYLEGGNKEFRIGKPVSQVTDADINAVTRAN